MGVDPVWVVLDPKAWLESSTWENKLLGAVVRDFYAPSARKPDDPSRYHPGEDGIITREFTDFVLSTDGSSDANAEARLTVLLGAKIANSSSTKIDLSAKVITLRRLDQDEDYWETLREDMSVKKVLPTWIKMAGKNGFPDVCLVVGVGVCEDVEIEWDKAQVAKREANSEAPLDAIITIAAGSPLPLPVGAEVKATVAKEKTQAYLFKAKQAKKNVFALELKVIEKKGWSGVRLGRGPAVEPGHQLGESNDGEDEEIDVENLVLHELRSIPVTLQAGAEDRKAEM